MKPEVAGSDPVSHPKRTKRPLRPLFSFGELSDLAWPVTYITNNPLAQVAFEAWVVAAFFVT